ncbi:bifunctional diguanylate cyclase/phosphodiesterase [Clostridium sp. LBM24168]
MKKKYEFVIDNLNEIIVEWNVEENKFYFSNGWKNITGYNTSDKNNFFEELDKVILLEDIDILDNTLMEYFEQNLNFFSCQYRIRSKNGKIKWILHKGKKISNGKKYNIIINYMSDITYKKVYEDEIRYLAYYDVTTNLPNKLFLIMKLNEYFCKSRLYSNFNMALIVIDIDKFKIINNIYGSELSDNLLKKVADTLKKRLKKNDILSSLDRDKFAILSTNFKDMDEIESRAKEFLNIFDRIIEIDNKKIYITVCIGISVYSDSIKNASEMLKMSDIALFNSKKIGKNSYSIYNEVMNDNLMDKVKIEIELKEAISEKKFTLYYQPQIDTNIMQIYGVEALLRWNHPKRGTTSPAYFIDIAEQNGMINDIGKFVLNRACSEMKKLEDMGYGNIRMSINISESQLEDSSFFKFVEHVLSETGVKPEYLCFEITERILINPTKKILNMLFAFKNMGIKIFVDDFGIKYSSLNYLTCIPMDGIKIDKSFIDKIENSGRDIIILKNIVNLALELNLEIIAEGVETERQLNFLKQINCNKIQGFIFSRPVSFDRLIEKLMNK